MIISFIGVLPLLIVFWFEARRDGFDEEKALDLLIVSIFFSLVFAKLFYLFSLNFSLVYILDHNFSLSGAIFGALLTVFFLARKFRWSFYRISDVSILSFSIALSITLLAFAYFESSTPYLLLSFWYFIFYFVLRFLRLQHSSGLAFSAFLIINPALIYFDKLQIYLVLITISLVNLYYRQKGIPMKANLPKNFILKTKKLLKRKEKELEAEQKRLIEDDPYMVEGRDEVDEYLDDTVEDIAKRESDLKLALIKDISIRVRKALAKIKIGNYGVCDVCGDKIKIERLKAYPQATTCVKHSS